MVRQFGDTVSGMLKSKDDFSENFSFSAYVPVPRPKSLSEVPSSTIRGIFRMLQTHFNFANL